MSDSFRAAEASSPSKHFYLASENDSTDLPRLPKALYVSVTGDVVVHNLDGVSVTFPAVPAGTILPIRAKRLLTATTATVIALA